MKIYLPLKMTYSGVACSLSKFALKVLGDKGRLPRKGSRQVKKSYWSNLQTSNYFRDSTLTLASVAGLELNGNSEAAVA